MGRPRARPFDRHIRRRRARGRPMGRPYMSPWPIRRHAMTQAKLIDISGAPAAPLDLWEPVIVTREEIAREAERLADLPRPANGRRESLFVHPRASAPGLGLAPGIRVTLSVLKPGERSEPVRQNATQVNFCIGGAGHSVVAGRRFDFAQYDVWNTPS